MIDADRHEDGPPADFPVAPDRHLRLPGAHGCGLVDAQNEADFIADDAEIGVLYDGQSAVSGVALAGHDGVKRRIDIGRLAEGWD
ncbi:MAG: hypothetical protein VW618_06400, partial [Alphaproteobacteria bacterium]